MRYQSLTLILFAILCTVLPPRLRAADDLDLLTAHCRMYLTPTSRVLTANGSVEQLMRQMRPDGSWGDIEYQDDTRGGWRAYRHLGNILGMARAYQAQGQPLYHKPELGKAIHTALGYWLDNDFKNPNWWYNEIGVPMAIGQIGLLMQAELTPNELDLMANRIMARSAIAMTGQNRVWKAGNTLVRGLLLKDYEMVRQAATVIGEEVRVTTKEGIQPDNSFHQHGPQQQFGNYGLSFASSNTTWARIFQGTEFAWPPEKIKILRDYLLQGEDWVVWKGAMDISSMGRQLDEDAAMEKGRGVARAMQTMAAADPEAAAQYLASIERNKPGAANDLVGNRYFWRSDYMVHRRPGFMITVKMCSNRVVGSESLNSENISGYHLADGATYLYRTGDEYKNIQPVWDWQKLPGVTCPEFESGVPRFGNYRIKSDFVGGVSDGQIGCAALDYNRDGVTGHKAWFFLDDAVVCLGSGIQAEDQGKGVNPVQTTINQCLLKGEVLACEDAAPQAVAPGNVSFSRLRWAWHDGVGYVFPNPAPVVLRSGEQSGSWRKVEAKRYVSDKPVKADVFLMTVNHGLRPRNASYATILLPGVEAQEMAARAQQPGVAVLENTPALQAVYATAQHALMAAFHQAGSYQVAADRKISVDAPCLVLVRELKGGTVLTIADPTQKLASLNVTWNNTVVPVKLPQGGEAGRSVTVKLP